MPARPHKSELFERVPQSPGRRRTLVARAWISRKIRGGVFWSNVSLGDGRTRTISTDTRNRPEALEFCRCHLLNAMSDRAAKPSKTTQPPHSELRLFG